MPIPKLEDNLVEYSFTVEEYKAARALNPLQIAYYHTLRAQLLKQKASELVPDSKELELSYIQRIVELDGKMNMLTELLGGHEAVLKELSNPNKSNINPDNLVDTTAARAAAQVHSS